MGGIRLNVRSYLALFIALALAAPLGIASHNDGVYDIPVWFEHSRRTLDVLIIPADHGPIYNGDGVLGGEDPLAEANPLTNAYTRAMIDSVANWDVAIDAYAPAWLKDRLVINVDVLGEGTSALPTQYEIVIASDENKLVILGIAMSGSPCIVLNSKFFVTSFTYEDMFNINAQEYGHCLGLDHVTDSHPTLDPMNGAYPHNPGSSGNPLHCVSNLDVKGLEGVFARTMGQPSSMWGVDGRVPVSAYETVDC